MQHKVPKKGNISLEKKKAFAGYFFIFPLIIGVILIFIPNMIQTLIFTVNDIVIDKGQYSLKYIGFNNFVTSLTVDPQFIRLLAESVRQLVTDIPVILIFSLFIATILNQKFRGRLLARSIFFVPVILATGIIAKVESLTNIMNIVEVGRQTGGVVSNTNFAGFEQLLSSLNFNTGLINIVVGAADGIYRVVQSSGIQIFIFMAALQEVPLSLYEAANVEGCSKWELFWKITLPVISPQILVCGVYTIVDTFSKPNSPMFEYINRLAFAQNQYGLATAMYMMYFLCIAVIIAVAGFAMSKFVFYNE
ncbi:MAG: sugar ABC transporter permease [Eubacteriales bacterium]|jgi:ABC-type sugar transport system permease subunit|nr:sugar ABC transporter permease [Eubacteriales bacterium]MDD4326787.1 sugar ABC transporter permease [Eubacteriales bacterium]